MNKEELKKGMKVWCWWRSVYLYYTGKFSKNFGYEFKDVCDVIVDISEDDLKDLRLKK